MGWVRLAYRLPAIIAYLLIGLSIVVIIFPRWTVLQRRLMIQRWSRWVLRSLGVEVVRLGCEFPGKDSAVMIVANHLSWLDIFVINSLLPCRFVAKAEIRSWPMVGVLCDRAGTIFVERAKRQALRDVMSQMERALQNFEPVAVFPEGTTGDMFELKPFHSNLLQAAVAVQAPVQPVALEFLNPTGTLELQAQFIGETTFVESMLRVLQRRKIVARIHVGAILGTAGRHRDEVCREARASIDSMLGRGVDADRT